MFIGSSFTATSRSKNVSDLPSFLQLYQKQFSYLDFYCPFFWKCNRKHDSFFAILAKNLPNFLNDYEQLAWGFKPNKKG